MEPVDYDLKGNPIYDPWQVQAQKLPVPIPGINVKKAWYEMTLDELVEAGYEPVKINFSPATVCASTSTRRNSSGMFTGSRNFYGFSRWM